MDEYFGPKTAGADKRFQLLHGLAADGIYGPKKEKALK
ncbi:peptidoglycan-binding protein [Bacillus safensis]